jgi:hypothetical protein
MVKQMDLLEDIFSRKQHLTACHKQLTSRKDELLILREEVKHEAVRQLERSVLNTDDRDIDCDK